MEFEGTSRAYYIFLRYHDTSTEYMDGSSYVHTEYILRFLEWIAQVD